MTANDEIEIDPEGRVIWRGTRWPAPAPEPDAEPVEPWASEHEREGVRPEWGVTYGGTGEGDEIERGRE